MSYFFQCLSSAAAAAAAVAAALISLHRNPMPISLGRRLFASAPSPKSALQGIVSTLPFRGQGWRSCASVRFLCVPRCRACTVRGPCPHTTRMYPRATTSVSLRRYGPHPLRGRYLVDPQWSCCGFVPALLREPVPRRPADKGKTGLEVVPRCKTARPIGPEQDAAGITACSAAPGWCLVRHPTNSMSQLRNKTHLLILPMPVVLMDTYHVLPCLS